MIVDDSAAIFLNNYLVKNKRKLNEVNNELSRKLQEVAKLKEKMTDFAQGQKYGAYDDVNEVRSRQAISSFTNRRGPFMQGGRLSMIGAC
jgi:hypothetical protein